MICNTTTLVLKLFNNNLHVKAVFRCLSHILIMNGGLYYCTGRSIVTLMAEGILGKKLHDFSINKSITLSTELP